MTDSGDWRRRPQGAWQDYGRQEYLQEQQPFQPRQYDPAAHQQRLQPSQQAPWGGAQYPPENGSAPVFQPGYQQSPPQSPPPLGPPQQPRAPRRRIRVALLGAGALIVGVIIGSAAGSSGKAPAAAAPAPTVTVTVTATPPAHPKAGHAKAKTAPSSAPAATSAASSARATTTTVATFSGNGDENTASFTVTGTWKLAYSFDCTDFGGSGNFAVEEDGGSDFNGVQVNALATSKSGTSWAYGDAGTHYLQIISECDWHLSVIDEG